MWPMITIMLETLQPIGMEWNVDVFGNLEDFNRYEVQTYAKCMEINVSS
jgi:hypothetical protein